MKDRHTRQGFLGPNSATLIADRTVAIVGLGGGGSHVVQQLAHIGFNNYIIFDADIVEFSNLNRLVGATLEDARNQTPKIDVASRVIRGLVDRPRIVAHQARWQQVSDELVRADVAVGCVDSILARRDLEAHCRRYLVPFIDIGMDVHTLPPEPPQMAGQVAISIPGEPCLQCLRVIRPEALTVEAARYGDAGGRPQVIWANGILASTAVGHVMALLTGWIGSQTQARILSFDGNRGTIEPDPRLKYLPQTGCPHYPLRESGPVD